MSLNAITFEHELMVKYITFKKMFSSTLIWRLLVVIISQGKHAPNLRGK